MGAEGGPTRTRRNPRLSIRLRITAVALVVVAVALSASGLWLAWMLHRSLWDGVVGTSTTEVQDLGALVRGGSLPHQLAVRTGTAAVVVGPGGSVLARTPGVRHLAALTADPPPVGHTVDRSAPPSLPGDDDGDLLVASTIATARGPVTIYVLAADEPVEEPVQDLGFLMIAAFPLLLVGAGAVAWLLAGRALRPVEEIRAEVAEIQASGLDQRVSVPGGEDELARLARTMNDLLSRLEASSRRQQRFVSDASHELRSPVASVLAQVEVAQAHPDGTDWPAVAESVHQEAQRLGGIVDDLLVLARWDEGQREADHEPVDLDELVLAEADRLRALGRVRVDLRSLSAGRVAGDRGQLQRALRNLVDNAERHAATTVGLAVTGGDGWVELAVSDDGPGIAPADRQRVFERFTRLEESRDRPTGGTGLGLAIVAEVAARHGGSVRVDGPAPGARLVMRLPSSP